MNFKVLRSAHWSSINMTVGALMQTSDSQKLYKVNQSYLEKCSMQQTLTDMWLFLYICALLLNISTKTNIHWKSSSELVLKPLCSPISLFLLLSISISCTERLWSGWKARRLAVMSFSCMNKHIPASPDPQGPPGHSPLLQASLSRDAAFLPFYCYRCYRTSRKVKQKTEQHLSSWKYTFQLDPSRFCTEIVMKHHCLISRYPCKLL